MKSAAAVACAFGVAVAAPASAQVVVGAATDHAGGAPVAGAIMSLATEGPARIAPTLAGDGGRFTVRAPRAGQYRLRAEAVGYRMFLSAPFTVADGDTVRVSAVLDAQRNMLAAVRVTGATECQTDPRQGERTAAVWEEIRKALTSTEVGAADRRTAFDLELTYEELSRVRSMVSQRSTASRGFATGSYGSVPAELLARTGYVVEIADSIEYYGPDAPLLMSPQFLSAHCFSTVERKPLFGAREIGLRFTPVNGHLRADISGTMWLDRETSMLRRIEFAFDVPSWPSGVETATGEVQYDRTSSGQWYVNRWEMRMPVLSINQSQGTSFTRISSWRVRIGTAKPVAATEPLHDLAIR
jgi:hypothetical protein